MAAVKSAFAEAQGVAESQVAVTGIEEITWDTAALGCPEPGESHAQVLTPGYRIEVLTDEGTVIYHTDRPASDEPARIVRCDEPARTGSGAFGGPALELARQDLADRLGLETADFELDAGFPAPVSRLICDDELGATPEPGPRRVILEFHLVGPDDVHVYRTWAEDILYCGTTEDLIYE